MLFMSSGLNFFKECVPMKKTVMFFLAVLCMATFGCGGSKSSKGDNGSNSSTFTVTYDANGASSGTTPSDSNSYAQGAAVTTLANTGSLVKGNYVFMGWNTAADASGMTYSKGQTFSMGGANLILYARWSKWVAVGSGMDGEVDALAADGSGNIYAGGLFTTAGGTTVNYIAKWDGNSWSALGSGMIISSLYAGVSALIFDKSGNLYAGGSFTSAGGVAAKNIAVWNGSSWSAVGNGLDGSVLALTFDNSGNLYASGSFLTFTTTGGTKVTVNGIAKWNGTTWSAVGSGMTGYMSMSPAVSSLAVDSTGNLYAGGYYNTAGGVSVNGFGKWDGANWTVLGSGPGLGDYINAIVFDKSGNLYAAGDAYIGGGNNGIAKWNGSSWSALGTGLDGIAGPDNASVMAVAIDSSGDLYVGGYFKTAGGVTANDIARWDGSSWSWSETGLGFSYRVMSLVIDSNGNLYAGGTFTNAGAHIAKLAK
jgi:uncharacterized repeat protein (TIGR02543 family)